MRIVIEIDSEGGGDVRDDTTPTAEAASAIDAGPAPDSGTAATSTALGSGGEEAIDAGPAGGRAIDDASTTAGASGAIDAGAAPT